MAVLYGQVEHVIYRDEREGFAVLAVRDADDRSWRVTGPLASFEPGERLRLEGEWIDHPKHGRQFRVARAVPALADPANLREMLAANIRGLGEELADRIVTVLGPDALEVIAHDPDALRRVPGIGAARARMIREQLAALAAEHEAYHQMLSAGVPPAMIRQLLRHLGAEAWPWFRADPYRAGRSLGVSWAIQERWAARLGLAPTAACRIQGAVIEVLRDAAAAGHVCVPEDAVKERTWLLLHSPKATFAERLPREWVGHMLASMVQAGHEVVGEAGYIYLPDLFWAEQQAAEFLLRLARAPRSRSDPDQAGQVVRKAAEALGLQLAPEQEEAALAVVAGESCITVLTGGPGTGKSTVVRVMVDAFATLYPRDPVFLAAPTGLAAQNLAAKCGREASTLHRLLEPRLKDGRLEFGRGPSNPLPRGLLVVDETSMIDLPLAAALLGAVAPGSLVCFVGDEDQLPAVGPGAFFADLIRSGLGRVVRLQTVFRQAQDSPIVRVAYAIRGGQSPPAAEPPLYLHLRVANAEEALERLLRLARAALRQKRPLTVLVPQRRGPLGAEALNARLQELFNPPGPGKGEMHASGVTYRAGDRVMQTSNLYDEERLRVANGTLGMVVEASPRELQVRFDSGEEVTYSPAEAGQGLRHAWALTVHKSQGLEFPGWVVVLLSSTHQRMLGRSLVYTAVTRAKERLVLLDEGGALEQAIRHRRGYRRTSLLLMRLAAGGRRGAPGHAAGHAG